MTSQTILLVEDSPEDAFFITRKLKEYYKEYELVHFTNMAGARDYLQKNRDGILLTLLDLGLPDTSGSCDTYRDFKDMAPDLPIVILTGMADHNVAIQLVKEGADDFINKDVLYARAEMLRNAVDFALSRHQNLSAMNKSLKEKEQVISWMSGGYSVQS